MELAVLIYPQPDGSSRARVPVIRGLEVTAPTRELAVAAIRGAVAESHPADEIVLIDLPPSSDGKPNQWIEMAGIFADDPTLEPMLEEIYAARDASRESEWRDSAS